LPVSVGALRQRACFSDLALARFNLSLVMPTLFITLLNAKEKNKHQSQLISKEMYYAMVKTFFFVNLAIFDAQSKM